MNIFNTGEYLSFKKKFLPKQFNIEGIDFPMIALTEDLMQKVKECETYNEMILMAADYGLSSDGIRAIDDEEMTLLLCDLWLEAEMQIDCEPSLKHQVGVKVCEISGLTQFVEEKRDYEKLEEEERLEAEQDISVGDHRLPGDITLGELEADTEAAAAA